METVLENGRGFSTVLQGGSNFTANWPRVISDWVFFRVLYDIIKDEFSL